MKKLFGLSLYKVSLVVLIVLIVLIIFYAMTANKKPFSQNAFEGFEEEEEQVLEEGFEEEEEVLEEGFEEEEEVLEEGFEDEEEEMKEEGFQEGASSRKKIAKATKKNMKPTKAHSSKK